MIKCMFTTEMVHEGGIGVTGPITGRNDVGVDGFGTIYTPIMNSRFYARFYSVWPTILHGERHSTFKCLLFIYFFSLFPLLLLFFLNFWGC